MINKILDFLFGKAPDIFDNEGNVRHKLPKEHWETWQSRYLNDPEYNWRQHTGMKAKDKRAEPSTR